MLEEILNKAKRENLPIKIYAHRFPDGDAVSSSKVLERFFRENGVRAEYVVKGRPNNSWNSILGYTNSSTKKPSPDSISIILDTSTLANAENKNFLNSRPENTYVIDHHGKVEGTLCIEDELHVPPQNVIRDSNCSSTCEILADELHSMRSLNPDLSTMLLIGMCTDTASFKFLKENTLENLKTLLKSGANYRRVQNTLQRKRRLKQEVGLAKAFLDTKRIKVGNTYINFLGLSNEQISELESKYDLRAIQKKIFKLADIEDSSINVVVAENSKGSYDSEFRSTSFCGNVDVLQTAVHFGGGGHYNASGCNIESTAGLNTVSRNILQTITDNSLERLQAFTLEPNTENDKRVISLLRKMGYFKSNATINGITQLQNLLKSDVHYERDCSNLISFKKFMLRNEILSHIPDSELDNRRITLNLDSEFTTEMQEKYGASIDDILEATDAFKELDLDGTTIIVPNMPKIRLDSNGNRINNKTH